MTDLTMENYRSEVEHAGRPVLIDFYADRCGPCRAFAPTLEALDAEIIDAGVVIADYGAECKFCRVNIDTEETLTRKFDILSVPTLVLMQNGEVQQRIRGLRAREDILRILNLGNF